VADSPEVLWATPSAPSKRFHGEALLWMGIHRRRWGKSPHCMMPRGCNAYLLSGEKIARVCEFDMFSMMPVHESSIRIMYCIISSTAALLCLFTSSLNVM
jgi:hypothetical protein